MKIALFLMHRFGFCAVVFLALTTSFVSADPLTGVSDPERAQYNWVMHCRGCHQMDATGSKGGAPNMKGVVAQFLHLKEGRDFLARVPGVAFVALPDNEVAELLNWMVQRFDATHMPEDFVPYSTKEVSQLRENPLISKAETKRNELLETLKELDASDD